MNEFKFTISHNSTDTILKYSPAGWDEIKLSWERSSTYFGLIRSFALSLKFVRDGADLLRSIYYTSGMEALVYLSIEKLNRETFIYESFYSGEIDLSTFQDDTDFVEVNLIEGGLQKMLKANEKTDYEFSLSDADVEISYDHVSLLNVAKWTLYASMLDGEVYVHRINADGGMHIMPLTFVEASSFVMPFHADLVDCPAVFATGYFMQVFEPGMVLMIDVAIDFTNKYLTGATTYSFDLVMYNGDSVTYFENYEGTRPPTLEHIVINAFTIIEPAREEKLKLCIFWHAEPPIDGVLQINSLDITATYLTREAGKKAIKAFKASTLAGKLVSKMSPGSSFSSSLLNSSKIAISCGDAIRGFVNASIKTSFQDFFTSMNALLCVGASIEDNALKIESKEFYFDDTDILEINEFTDLKIKAYTEHLANSAKVGYDDNAEDDINGRYEVNAGQVYSLPITKAAKELDLISPYRADMFAVETLANQGDADNQSTGDDNDIFMFIVNTDGTLDRNFDDVTGLPASDSAFNLLITPKRNLIRHARYLKAIASTVKFESAERNKLLESTYLTDNSTVDEDSNLDISSTTPLFLAVVAEVTALTDNIHKQLAQHPNLVIRINGKGLDFKGFILDISVETSKKRETQLTLLLTPDTDLTQFI